MPHPDQYDRIEAQLAQLTHAVTQLVRMEERQATHSRRLDLLEESAAATGARLTELKEELSKWVNRGFGLWGCIAALWALLNSPVGQRIVGGS